MFLDQFKNLNYASLTNLEQHRIRKDIHALLDHLDVNGIIPYYSINRKYRIPIVKEFYEVCIELYNLILSDKDIFLNTSFNDGDGHFEDIEFDTNGNLTFDYTTIGEIYHIKIDAYFEAIDIKYNINEQIGYIRNIGRYFDFHDYDIYSTLQIPLSLAIEEIKSIKQNGKVH